MSSIARVVRVLEGVVGDVRSHAANCGDRVLGIALSPDDHRELQIVELWGLPVLAWDEVPAGRYRLLCEATVVLIPDVDTVQELFDRWTYDLPRPMPAGA